MNFTLKIWRQKDAKTKGGFETYKVENISADTSFLEMLDILQKFEAYECGIPTRGKSWMQFRVGYYLFAILFLMFDVETAFLFPWAVVMRDMGPQGLISVLFFFIILVLGLAYAWRKGALEWK